MNLVKYDQARHALQVCASVDDAKSIKDQAQALEAYAKQRKDVEMEAWVSEIKVRAHIRIGELSEALETNQGFAAIHATGGANTKKAALKKAGISPSAALRAEKLANPKTRSAVEAFIAKKVAQGKPVKVTEVLAAVEAQDREAKNKEGLHKSVDFELPAGLQLLDFRVGASALADECAELVFTDPPYDSDSASLYGDAALIASRILRPGGSFIAYCGQTQLPKVLQLCSEHLRYWWTIACVHEGGNQILNKLGIRCGWKPLVWFVKGTRGDVQNVLLDTVRGDREKSHHVWQQAESEASYYIEKLTSQHGLVVDFFAGGGTTPVAAAKLGRPWIAFEINPDAAAKCDKRLKDIKGAA